MLNLKDRIETLVNSQDPVEIPLPGGGGGGRGMYSDEKVANRDIKVWHAATEKGP
jgi:N-methylhydantoinase B/oxoprolinase/acetone carboxylase alpha subunit